MILPAACPGISVVESTFTDRCWADVPFTNGLHGSSQCRTTVDPDDQLGLCLDHIAELINLDDLVAYPASTHQD